MTCQTDPDLIQFIGKSLQEYEPDSVPVKTPIPSSNDAQTPVFGSTDPSTQYPVVAIGGTFDHLHAGHKILLSCAAFLTTKKLIVGISAENLLTKKQYSDLLEPLEKRTQKTREFLNLVKPGIEYDLPALTDIYGPTSWDPDIQALVVSKETLSGASASTSSFVSPEAVVVIETYSCKSPPGERIASAPGFRYRCDCTGWFKPYGV